MMRVSQGEPILLFNQSVQNLAVFDKYRNGFGVADRGSKYTLTVGVREYAPHLLG